jgi:hypothetical protein
MLGIFHIPEKSNDFGRVLTPELGYTTTEYVKTAKL